MTDKPLDVQGAVEWAKNWQKYGGGEGQHDATRAIDNAARCLIALAGAIEQTLNGGCGPGALVPMLCDEPGEVEYECLRCLLRAHGLE